jgi:murein L,D-transpeptidase YafK
MKLLLLLFLVTLLPQNTNFLKSQLKYSRVRTAKAKKDSIVKGLFESKGIEYPSNKIFIRIFKSEALLEIWAMDSKINKYIKIKSYDICALSGRLGPKRRQGDLQIPEGFYYVSHFNPASNFYLSLKVNYPNKSDRILGYKQSLGGDIFIHGNCVTIGCVPITDTYIKEVYWMAVQAKASGQNKIPVHIYPAKLDNIKFDKLKNNFKHDKTLLDFWTNLKNAYDYFEKYKLIPEIDIDNFGKYIIEEVGLD